MDCIFCKIATKEMPKEFIYEDDDVMVFPDIYPVKPIHLLIVPKQHNIDLGDVADSSLFAKLFAVVQKMIKDKQLNGKGYRIAINGGGGQLIDHLHIHLMAPVGKRAKM